MTNLFLELVIELIQYITIYFKGLFADDNPPFVTTTTPVDFPSGEGGGELVEKAEGGGWMDGLAGLAVTFKFEVVAGRSSAWLTDGFLTDGFLCMTFHDPAPHFDFFVKVSCHQCVCTYFSHSSSPRPQFTSMHSFHTPRVALFLHSIVSLLHCITSNRYHRIMYTNKISA